MELHWAQYEPSWPYVLFGKNLVLEAGKEHKREVDLFPLALKWMFCLQLQEQLQEHLGQNGKINQLLRCEILEYSQREYR